MKRTMNKRDVSQMNKLSGDGVSDEKISKYLGVDIQTMNRFRPKKEVPAPQHLPKK